MISLPWSERFALPARRTMIVAAVVALVLVAVIGGAWYWQIVAEHRAAAAYAGALAQLTATRGRDVPPDARATARRQLEAALTAYPSAGMAAQAAFEIGALRFQDREYPGARSAWEIALARAASPTLRTLARLGIASTWEAERNFAKAADAYAAAVAQLKPSDFQYEESLMDLARVQDLAGRKADAIATYRRLLKDVPATRRADDVRARLANLGATP